MVLGFFPADWKINREIVSGIEFNWRKCQENKQKHTKHYDFIFILSISY